MWKRNVLYLSNKKTNWFSEQVCRRDREAMKSREIKRVFAFLLDENGFGMFRERTICMLKGPKMIEVVI